MADADAVLGQLGAEGALDVVGDEVAAGRAAGQGEALLGEGHFFLSFFVFFFFLGLQYCLSLYGFWF